MLPRVISVLLTMLSFAGDLGFAESHESSQLQQPNIVIILADDLGYGDIGAYNVESKIPTPNLDKLASDGVRFTDAHSPAAVCTPTRYSLLTGRYAWRSRLKSGVLWGYSPLLIEPDRQTVASLLRDAGYSTAAIGKWHLGFGDLEPDFFGSANGETTSREQENSALAPGPNEIGFEYFFGIPASLDMKPYVYIENGSPVQPVNGTIVAASNLRREGGAGFWRRGQIANGFTHTEVLPTISRNAVSYIRQRSVANAENPFFLYFALTAPHTPWLPTEEYQGRSQAGPYGDFVVQVDDIVGRIVSVLADTGDSENTLIMFASDNGAHWLPSDIQEYGHLANGSFRGQKADIFEGGHRVPFIVKWPARIEGGRTSKQPMTLADVMATISAIVDAPLGEGAAPDSFDISQELFQSDEGISVAREPLIHHSMDGMFAIRKGEWKLIEGLGSGGFTQPAREGNDAVIAYQLYNLQNDPEEANNLAARYPGVVNDLARRLDEIRTDQR